MTLSDMPVVPVLVAIVLLTFAYAFVRHFHLPAKKLDGSLDDVIRKLDAARAAGQLELASCFAGDERLAAIWQEYGETLHTQREIDPSTGEFAVRAVRSTVPAEVYFSPHSVVDGRVHAEFFKHLPGIFTGVGIIGTFFGLLKGLWLFRISEDAGVVRNSLTSLLHGVSEAFAVSAFAILLAMVATVLEKYRLNSLYGKVGRLAHAIDATYEAGAGEEYLARLVSSSEESASQTRILKDALVSDLKEILTDLAERQIAATTQRSGELGTSIASALTDALREPLDQIAGAVGRVSQDQSSAVTQLLTDVLASFSDRLEGMFGSQLSGIGDMQQRTVDAMQTAVARLQDLTAGMEAAGTRATDAMSAKLMEAVEAAEARQTAITEELRTALSEMRSGQGAAQEQTRSRLEGMLDDLGRRLGEAVAGIERTAEERSRRQAEDDGRRSEAAARQVAGMGESVGALTTNVDTMLAAVREMVSRIELATSDAFSRLNGGADTLLAAAGRFETSGREAADGFSRIATVTSGLADAAGSVAGAARSLDSVMADYRSARDAVGTMVEGLRATVESASREASLTADVLSRIEGAAQRLAAAQVEADGFLDEVAQVIATSHEKFSEGMRGTVVDANRQFHAELSQATGLLRETIQELEFALPQGGRRAA
ncbi:MULTISPECIES: anti-phage ZorAB system protein ZorA [Sphingomonas]|uniref:Anti-phage ZorAB system protein ZorA n=1 Tax=Sphingomonas molluscorum TaxID=418184 RepID=A0ABU8Q540_9SPHN|nr:anti-phage ZorAB system protein ZorA [Sphingomonas sp. JUb134]MBM7406246.1 hypothetical protein [Sphingomonas sp. JUb134]